MQAVLGAARNLLVDCHKDLDRFRRRRLKLVLPAAAQLAVVRSVTSFPLELTTDDDGGDVTGSAGTGQTTQTGNGDAHDNMPL